MFSSTTHNSSRSFYYSLWTLAQLIGCSAVILIGILYRKKFDGGDYDWSKSPFDFHPLMMTIGFLFCYGNAILSYRTGSHVRKPIMKVFHASILALSLLFAAIGLAAVIRSKNNGSRLHFMALHSWMGLITLIMFAFQWIAGFICFLFPKLSLETRQRFMPSHRVLGKTIFVSGLATILMGLTEDGTVDAFFEPNDVKRTKRLILIFSGLLVAGFGLIVIYLLENFNFQRPPDEENENITISSQ